MAQDSTCHSTAISFVDRLASSEAFKTLFRDGMKLVEDTAAYLDGNGRADSKSLPRGSALAYAAESMRLTTRLMQMASWLLLQRAVNEGEMTQAEALSDKKRTCIAWQNDPIDTTAAAHLPAALIGLIETSLRLQERVMHLDALISDREPARTAQPANPLEGQLSKLRAAFCD